VQHTMASESKTPGLRALVSGSTGAIGRPLVNQLLNDAAVASVVVLVRRENSFPKSAKLTEVVVNFDELKSDVFANIDVVFCCLGTTIKDAGSQAAFFKVDHDFVVQVAKAAKAAGVPHFSLVTSIGATTNTSNFYLKTKGQVEQDVKASEFKVFSVFRPSMLVRPNSKRCGECVALFCMSWVCCCFGCCCAQYAAVKVETVARAMIVDALSSSPGGFRVYDGSDACEQKARGTSESSPLKAQP